MKDYRALRNSLSDAAKAEATAAKHEILLDMALRQFRKDVVGMTQVEVAERLSVSQPEVSRLEARRDMLIGTLKEYCQAVGAELHIVLQYGGTSVRLMTPEPVKGV